MQNIVIPEWLHDATERAIVLAEKAIIGEKRGADRKRFVKDTLKRLAKEHDLGPVPNWLEDIAEPIVIDIFVDLTFRQIKQKLAAIKG